MSAISFKSGKITACRPNIPFFMTEGNIGGGAGPSTVKSGLWLADYVGSMMSEGAGATYYFHYMPYPRQLGGFGNFLWIDENYRVIGYPPQYLAAQLITKEWVQPVDAPHRLFKASSDVTDAAGTVLVTAYAVERPDGQWSVMLVNRDQFIDHTVKLVFADTETNRDRYFSASVDRITFGSAEYQWHPEGRPEVTPIPTDPRRNPPSLAAQRRELQPSESFHHSAA